MYKELENVARGVEQQLLACTTALEKHDEAPEEIAKLLDLLEKASQICSDIQAKADSES